MADGILPDQKRILRSLLASFIWIAILWGVELTEVFLDTSFHEWGIHPRYLPGAIGILTGPFIHGGFDHLISNSTSLLFLAAGLFYFYRRISWQVILLVFLIAGGGVWLYGRSSMHIGASGIVYGIAFFLFFSGIFRKEPVAIALSLITVMFHGSMVWGMMPLFTDEHVSWESHLFGGIGGALAAFLFRKKGPMVRKKYSWEENDEPSGQEVWDYRQHTPPPEGFKHPGSMRSPSGS